MEWIIEFFKYFLPFSLLLGTLVFIHELGHYLAARYFKVRVEVFSLGFGPKLLGYKWGETYYCISLIPLGGYVKMFGDNPKQEIKGEDRKAAFLCQKPGPKSIIALAGPLMNLFIAVILFAFVGGIGRESIPPYLGDMSSESLAYQSGLRPGDLILTVNEQPVSYWRDVQKWVQKNPGAPLVFQIQRQDEKKNIQVTPKKLKNQSLSILANFIGSIEGMTAASQSAHIGVKDTSSLAYQHGLRTFDEIKSIHSIDTAHWRELEQAVQSLPENLSALNIKVQRDEELISIQLPLSSSSFNLAQAGIEKTNLYVDRVKKGSPAYKAGLLRGDRILSIEGKVLKNWTELSQFISQQESSRFSVVVVRDGVEKRISMQTEPMPIIHEDGSLEHRHMIGVASAHYISFPKTMRVSLYNPFRALWYGVQETVKWIGVTGKVLYKLISGSISHRVLGGPISIAKAAKNSFSQSVVHFLSVMAIISVNLFLMNLLPIPILDGGHLLLFIIESIRGSALSVRKQEFVQTIGLAVVLFFIALTIVNDIKNWSIFW